MSYKSKRSEVTVEFIDGEVRTYTISASVGLANYLNQELQDGALRLSDFANRRAVVIPAQQIKQVEIQEMPDEPEAEVQPSMRDPVEDRRSYSVKHLKLGSRALAVLERFDVYTYGDLVDLPEDYTQQGRARGCGATTAHEINEARVQAAREMNGCD